MQPFERELLTLLPRLRRFSRSLAPNVTDADDLCQVALVRALNAKEQWQPGTKMDSWMFRIVHNCWIDEVRSRARRSVTFLPEEAGAHVSVDGNEQVELQSEADAVALVMKKLPDEQREAVALVLIEGLGYREAAEVLEIPIGTLTSRVVRGRQALIRGLEVA